jgi:hypothetical protein
MTHWASSVPKVKLDLLSHKKWIALADSAGESASGGVRMTDVLASCAMPSVSVCVMEVKKPKKGTGQNRQN